MRTAGCAQVVANVTPNGWGDAITTVPMHRIANASDCGRLPVDAQPSATSARLFIKPHEVTLPLGDVLASLAAYDATKRAVCSSAGSACGDSAGAAADAEAEAGEVEMYPPPLAGGPAPYVSFQNDNLRSQAPQLLKDIGNVPFAPWKLAEAEAVNLWVGDERNTSSCHKDHYENLYAVIQGEKVFSLFPPHDILWLYEQPCVSARYVYDDPAGDGAYRLPGARASWSVRVECDAGTGEPVRQPWIAAPADRADVRRFPLQRHASPVVAHVRAGEVLYLPSLWYHQVAQRGLTIAVNAWHDMSYCGARWAHFQQMCMLATLTTRQLTFSAVEEDEGSDAEAGDVCAARTGLQRVRVWVRRDGKERAQQE
ncbi:cupin-like domain-containing protein [archaeon]|nr:MAG: cupin-like domain-containing protein [archaeon]